MKVLVACEFSGVVRRAFRALGHDAWSCDLLPAEDGSPFHIQGDAVPLLTPEWDLLVAHPVCTRLANSGVRWLAERGLWEEMHAAAAFFLKFKNAPIKRRAIENPIPHKYARALIGDYTQLVQPWMFGDGETKATCWWLNDLPQLRPTKIVEGRHARVHHMPPSVDRAKERSRFMPGMAAAMASQWGRSIRLAAAA